MFAEIISQTTDASRHESRRSWNIFSSSFFHQFCHSFWLAPNCRLPCTKGMRLESPDTRAEMQSFPCSPQWCSLLFTKRVSRLIKRFRAFTASRVFLQLLGREGETLAICFLQKVVSRPPIHSPGPPAFQVWNCTCPVISIHEPQR